MKKKEIENAILTLQRALSLKYGGGSEAQIHLTSDFADLDDEDHAIICDKVSARVLAAELAKGSS